MFQFATRQKVIEDTDLISLEEANKLWDKYTPKIKEEWDSLSSPQMCIWIDCNSNTDYSKVGKEIDFRDCVLEDDMFFKITKELIK